MYPIVCLRCSAPPKLSLESLGNRTATVSWDREDEGEQYQLSYAPFGTDPDSGTVVSLTDPSYIVTGLEAGVREAIWVRKSCRYTTASYDTTVWSDWSAPVVFFPVWISGVEEENGVRVSSVGGRVVVENIAAEAQPVSVIDMQGREVERCDALAAGGCFRSRPCPPGVYMVRVGTAPARKVTVW